MKVILPPPKIETSQDLTIDRCGDHITYLAGNELYRRRYTSAAIARTVERYVEWWYRTLPNATITHDGEGRPRPHPPLWLCIMRAEDDAVSSIYQQSRARKGSCYASVPKNFDSL